MSVFLIIKNDTSIYRVCKTNLLMKKENCFKHGFETDEMKFFKRKQL